VERLPLRERGASFVNKLRGWIWTDNDNPPQQNLGNGLVISASRVIPPVIRGMVLS
jgi:hypothetical protein